MIGTGFHLSKRGRDHKDGGQGIGLTAQEFDRLSELSTTAIQPFMEQRPDALGAGESFTISSDNDTQYSKKVTLGSYNECPTCNVRLYCKNGQTPCKPGVALSTADWASIKSCLSRSPEALMACDVYTALLVDVLVKGLNDNCEGCAVEHPSQTRHTCQGGTGTVSYADGQPVQVPYTDFLERMAAKARFHDVVVTDPFRWYRHMRVHVRQGVIDKFKREQQGETFVE